MADSDVIAEGEHTATLQRLLDKYGTKQSMADALGATRQTIHIWFKSGHLPEIWQYRLTTPGATWERSRCGRKVDNRTPDSAR